MIKLKQNKLVSENQRGNCLQTTLACLMECEIDDVIDIHNYFDQDWITILYNWLDTKGYEINNIHDHKYDDSLYLVQGHTTRSTFHICIYKNGELYYDVHPSDDGLIDEVYFQELVKL